MLFSEIIGQKHIKKHLTTSVNFGRIPHAQLFVGKEGCGTLPMAIAYAQYILCSNTNDENDTGNESCNAKMNALSHPDLHFVFPVTTNTKIKSKPISNNFLNEWNTFVKNEPYGNLFDWYKLLEVENKQGIIGTEEALNIVKSLSLKSYEGGYKVMIIWMADKMNTSCANKLLKLIEEPPEKTVFILITENEELIINTIRSRCQVLHFPPLSETDISKELEKKHNLDVNTAVSIANQSEGNLNKAYDLVNNTSEDIEFEKWFIIWVRSAFKAKGNKSAIHDIISWSEDLAKTGRETQKKFLSYCIHFFRQALLYNYEAKELVYMKIQSSNFNLEKFAPFVHDNNIIEITETLENALYHIERNGNAKIILTDLSIKLTRLLHKKSQT